MTDTQNLKVGSDRAIEVVAPDPVWATVTNLGPNSAYYDDAASVSSTSNDGTLAAGSSLSFRATKFFVSAGRSRLVVEVPDRLSWLETQTAVFDPDSNGVPDGIVFGSANLYLSAADTLKTDDSLVVAGDLGVGPIASASDFAGAGVWADNVGVLVVNRSGSTSEVLRFSATGDTVRRFTVRADGQMQWGDGSGGQDVTLSRSGASTLAVSGVLTVGTTFRHLGSSLGFFNAAATTKPTVTGSRGGNAALADLLTELATLGLITDSSSA